MTFNSILKNISRHITLDEEETNYFTSLLSYKEIPKKTSLLKAGQLCKNINFVESGTLRAYHLDKVGKESTIMFAICDWWITDMHCFIHQRPAMMYIEAIENSGIFELSKENLERLFSNVPKFERCFRILMQNAYTREQLRIIENLTLSAEERYNNFLKKYPQIARQITQKQIASYLGITPEFLSALRKNKDKRIIS